MSRRAASRIVRVGSPFTQQPDPYGAPPESQGSGFLEAALADPADFISTKLRTLDRTDRSDAARFARDFRLSGGPFDLQVWGRP
jgi:hypothetical protein